MECYLRETATNLHIHTHTHTHTQTDTPTLPMRSKHTLFPFLPSFIMNLGGRSVAPLRLRSAPRSDRHSLMIVLAVMHVGRSRPPGPHHAVHYHSLVVKPSSSLFALAPPRFLPRVQLIDHRPGCGLQRQREPMPLVKGHPLMPTERYEAVSPSWVESRDAGDAMETRPRSDSCSSDQPPAHARRGQCFEAARWQATANAHPDGAPRPLPATT